MVGALVGRLHALIAQGDADALVQKGHLAQAHLEGVKVEIASLKDAGFRGLAGLDVGPEAHGGAGALGLADDLEVVKHLAALVFLLVDLAVLIDVDLQVLRQGVDHGRAHAVQAAGDLVAPAAELAAGVQHGQADLHRRTAHLRMDAHGEAAAVVAHLDGAVLENGHLYIVAETGQRLVDGVIDDLVHQVVQPALVGRADVHARAAAHGLQPLQHLYLALVIVVLSVHKTVSLSFLKIACRKFFLLYYYSTFLRVFPHPERAA